MIHYSQLEWISRNNSSQPIVLNYYPSRVTKIELNAAFLPNNTGGIFGNVANSTYYKYYASLRANELLFAYGWTGYDGRVMYAAGNYADDAFHKFEFTPTYIKIDNITKATTNIGNLYNYGYKLNLFAGNTTGNYCSQKLAEFIIYETVTVDQETFDEVIHDYVPVIRWLDRRIGMYDKITEQFYPAPANYTRGKILDLDHYTKNLELMINFIDTTSTYQFINELSNNFKLFDSEFTTLKNKDLNLVALLANIERKFATDASTKEAFWLNIRNKVDIVEGKSTILNTQIAKLSADYSRLELYELIATTNDLQTLIDAICATIMLDYYTKAEIDEMVAKGSGASMDNYYKKTEIDELIPQKEDLTIIDNFLQSREYYYNSVREFSRLNGKGE